MTLSLHRLTFAFDLNTLLLFRFCDMSRRTDVFKEFGFSSKEAEIFRDDLVDIAKQRFADNGPGTLLQNLNNDSTTYLTFTDIEDELEDEGLSQEEKSDLQTLLDEARKCEFTKQVCITVLDQEISTHYFSI